MNWSANLRQVLNESAAVYAMQTGAPHCLSLGHQVVMFQAYESADGQPAHGNFLPVSYTAIRANDKWSSRLGKRHPRLSALPEHKRTSARELDSSNSSDALLMNVFCHPGVLKRRQILELLGIQGVAAPEFGIKARLSFQNGDTDATELDMRAGSTVIEAKLTEQDFTAKPKAHVIKYKYFEEVFWPDLLPQDEEHYYHYQILRNILAARELNVRFCLVCDWRRPDLLRSYSETLAAVKPPTLRARCGFICWQEIASVAPEELKAFLGAKYGIKGLD